MLKKKMTKVLHGCFNAIIHAVGRGSASKMAMESAYDTTASNYSAAGGVYYDSGDYEYADEVSEENGSSQAETVEKGETTGRKLIRNVDMDVETESFDALLASAQSQAEELGGYIESSSISNSSYASSTSAARSARLTARIPSEKLDGYLAGISKQSNVTRKSESTEDVTLQYVDLQSHKKALLAEQESLLSMMEQAESIEDIIAINEQLTMYAIRSKAWNPSFALMTIRWITARSTSISTRWSATRRERQRARVRGLQRAFLQIFTGLEAFSKISQLNLLFSCRS